MKFYRSIHLYTVALLGIFLVACAGDPRDASVYDSASGATPEAASEVQPELSQSVVHKVSPEEGKRLMGEFGSGGYILVDVRTEEEYAEGYIEGAVLIPVDEISGRAEAELADKDLPVFVYCRGGVRSASAAETLAALGYAAVYDLGGIVDWPYGLTKN